MIIYVRFAHEIVTNAVVIVLTGLGIVRRLPCQRCPMGLGQGNNSCRMSVNEEYRAYILHCQPEVGVVCLLLPLGKSFWRQMQFVVCAAKYRYDGLANQQDSDDTKLRSRFISFIRYFLHSLRLARSTFIVLFLIRISLCPFLLITKYRSFTRL